VGDVGKVPWPHRCRLTMASTERQVAVCLRYQADTRDRDLPIWVQGLPKERHEPVKAKEQRSRTLDGSIRPLALRLDAQMDATPLKGHFQTPVRNFVADELFFRLGGVSTHRRGKGSEPERYHNAVAVQISTVRSLSPYQSRVSFCQTICESCKTCSSAGRRRSSTQGRPIM
jgi:hypothetical protein